MNGLSELLGESTSQASTAQLGAHRHPDGLRELILVGAQSFSIGLLGEFMTFQYHRKPERERLPIRDVVGDP